MNSEKFENINVGKYDKIGGIKGEKRGKRNLKNFKLRSDVFLCGITCPQGRFIDDKNFKNFPPTKFDLH